MKNLGETLKQARDAKGVEIRDAADATKIRGDFLRQMETGEFDFDLPEIYKRGFLRLYASYLGLDPKAVMADYDASISGKKREKESSTANKAKEQFFGEITSEDNAPLSPERRYDGESRADDMPGGPASSLESGDFKKSSYVKIGGIFFGLLAAVILLVAVISNCSKTSDSNNEPADSSASLANGEFSVTVTPLRDCYYKLSLASNESIVLFQGEVRAGASASYTTKEPLVIETLPQMGKLADLKIERNGEAIDASKYANLTKCKIVAPKKAQ